MDSIDHIWLILSGKGGVGKSSTTAQIGLTLAAQGFRVGILDVDLTGPSMPRVLGLESSTVRQSSAGWVPVYTDETQSLGVMSIGFLVKDRGEGIVWRGPKKTAMIRQFMKDVAWGHLDYLLVDTPPGTSDEHISLAEELQAYSPEGAILVTTPQEVAAADVRKELSFCKKVNFKILGVIENLSGYICPHCSECTHIFSKGGGEKLAEQYSVPFLGSVPMDSGFIKMVEDQEVTKVYSSCALSKIFDGIVKSVIQAELVDGNSH